MKFERLGNIAELIAGQSPPSSSYNSNGVGIPFFQGKADYGIKFPSVRYWCNEPIKISLPDDILISMRAPVGPVNINIIESCIGRGLSAIRVKKNANRDYIFYWLKANEKKIANKGTGSVFTAITQKILSELEIPLPSLSDQIQIANILSKAETLIEQRKQSIALLDEFLKSTFLEMFGDCTMNKKKWKKVELKYFGEIITGNTPPRNNDENYSSNFIEWIKTDNIPSENTFITHAVEYLSESGLKYARTVDSGALLVACIAGSIQSVGRAALTNRKVSFNQQINAIQPNDEVAPLFLYWLFKISRKYVQNAASNGMKKILTKGGFEKIKMIKPPLELQTHFASIVTKTETLKEQYKNSLQELENLYGSLSQKAFKGELVTPKIYAAETPALSIAAEPQVAYKKSATNELNKDELLQLYFILHNIAKHSNRMPEEATLAEVKMEKSCHLGEAVIEELQFNRKPLKQMFGPADFDRLFKLFDFAARNDIFYYDRDASYKKFTEGKNFMKYFGKAIAAYRPFVKKVNSLLDIFLALNTNQMDLYATVFAAWNNLLILKQPAALEAIAKEAKWHEKKNRFSNSDIKEAIEFLKTNHLEPKGKGKLVFKVQ